MLAISLLIFTLGAFCAQRFWLGNKSYTTVSGKGDAGVPPSMPNRLAVPVYIVAGGWAAFTVVIYCMIVYASFVEFCGG